jgi:hypothetical protein
VKYLKLFESTDILYSKITPSEYKSMGEVPFERRWVDKIDVILSDDKNTYYHSDPWDKDYRGNPVMYKLQKYTGSYHVDENYWILLPNAGIGNMVYIVKQCEDEWFKIKGEPSMEKKSVPEKFFKCDSFEGVLQFLRTETRLR